ncbi:MAG: hypothetical protein KF864_00170 [Phycisphaeraceae bacterium]|nr:hypothetical protein [Phycisphaeraceae bacterium]MBX3410529.1 hypothetical protein [Phycisphaeraceae bacterium]
MKRVASAVVLLFFGACLLGGCQTTKGLGKDIQSASEATERAIKGN